MSVVSPPIYFDESVAVVEIHVLQYTAPTVLSMQGEGNPGNFRYTDHVFPNYLQSVCTLPI